jgi:hypothetical protein
MISREATLAETEVRVGVLLFFMKPKILSLNLRGLNEGDKRLRVKSLLRK